MLEKYLEEIGLSEKESQIYLALLQVDSESIQDLAKRTEINRTTVYPVLETLEKKGLVSEVQKGKKVEYVAAPPERLETFVERQKVVLEERAERLKDIIPQIKSIQRESGEKPIVKYFEGREGAITAFEEFYSFFKSDIEEEDGYFIYSRDLLDQAFTEAERDKFLKARLGKKVKPHTVYTNSSGDYLFKTEGVRTRLDHTKYKLDCDISVIRDRIVITTLGGSVSTFLIISKDVAETIKNLVLKINEQG
jgi:sugar-specific transcriptional regulator TrmB